MAKDQTKKKSGGGGKGKKGDIDPALLVRNEPPRLKQKFYDEVDARVAQQFGLTNPMQRPRMSAIVLNVNMGRFLEGNKIPANVKQTVLDTLVTITGQKPVVLLAKKSVSNFKVREGAETAAKVTLRRDQMWDFFDRLTNLAMPRIKDFRGVNDKSFDRQGNYSMGLTEQGVFPEIDMANTNFTHGININIVFDRSSPAMSEFILRELGMPFRKPEEPRRKRAPAGAGVSNGTASEAPAVTAGASAEG